jgi:hypothetical protein
MTPPAAMAGTPALGEIAKSREPGPRTATAVYDGQPRVLQHLQETGLNTCKKRASAPLGVRPKWTDANNMRGKEKDPAPGFGG